MQKNESENEQRNGRIEQKSMDGACRPLWRNNNYAFHNESCSEGDPETQSIRKVIAIQ